MPFLRIRKRNLEASKPTFFKKRTILLVLFVALTAPLVLLAFFRFAPVPITPLMTIRIIEGEGLEKQWVELKAISPFLIRAVIASEDAKFCRHSGFDWDAMINAANRYVEGGSVLGASTISMQTAKNLFLWPGRDFLRKTLEAYFTLGVELIWPKDRIIEVYLNIIEWGPGIYGAEAAAQHYFNKPALKLTREEAAALAAVLPNPRRFSPVSPSKGTSVRIARIKTFMEHVKLSADGVCK